MERISVVQQAGRAIRLLLLSAMLLALAGKLVLWSTDWAEGWEHEIDQLLFLTLGVYGLLNGLHLGRSVLGIVSSLGGVFLLVSFFLPAFDWMPLAMLVAVVCVLVGAIFARSGE